MDGENPKAAEVEVLREKLKHLASDVAEFFSLEAPLKIVCRDPEDAQVDIQILASARSQRLEHGKRFEPALFPPNRRSSSACSSAYYTNIGFPALGIGTPACTTRVDNCAHDEDF